MVLKTIGENASTTPAAFDDMTHENSVDKVVDMDPKNQHEDTVKGREDKLKEIVVILNSCLTSLPCFELVAKKEVLQPLYNDVEAQLATITQELACAILELAAYTKVPKLTTEDYSLQQKGGQALGIEQMSLLEEKLQKISREVEKLKGSLHTRQQVLDKSMQLLVRCDSSHVLTFVNCCESARNSPSLFSVCMCLPQNGLTNVVVDRNGTIARLKVRKRSMELMARIGGERYRMLKETEKESKQDE
jgi:hypothetical protein